ncbi:serine/threonine-protein kinase [Cellulomonas fimi]|uniref:non-specific serine/threonine protein kinase n=1 Tax=Cellulomonas fimi (strain ATCC 484 / DSM 20113 / JCM 1341 / CCUG 24087 / LMG 16345 / NBRC 15513 / NCIMB 8980 / NCTC 7547 / NRS-133) TaxID=590998 RepID=F4H2W8_CELFA|nr:serine/threonine-protein kinase [Cellulomonas fimi]AEE46467.1 serine/threonine protein kinase [Cellulomonas fimi ATCC 484]NNH07759.1 serine/threonine protein kinase [Cellulomonas fimi]VEH33121.1 Serine/threonine-protein kinase pknK [Cellulomonas fimi]
MTARREASAPPRLPGYEYQRVLGLGGFADVFLYQQELPRREVAVKVLLAGSLDDEVRTRFQSEANLMAQLSHHPSIVTIHHAAIAEDGRPYLVMEYCSRPGLAERYRQERLSVAESLRIAIRLASAIETAHRAGILHRDIKPANVLTTDFGWPALTDFGIAATTGQGGGATVGMSIPWSPPELLGDQPTGDERSDVYSLGATVYSLLAGRTPFEIPGAANGAQQLVARIERSPLPPTGRDDVPVGLQHVLERSMAKDPARRFPSAAAMARALQGVEADLRLPVTSLDLPDDVVPDPEPLVQHGGAAPAEDATRVRSVVTLDPNPAPPAPAPAADDESTRLRGIQVVGAPAPAPAPAGAPVMLPPAEQETADAEPGRSPRTRALAGAGAALVLLGAVAVVAFATLTGDPERPTPPTDDLTGAAPEVSTGQVVPSPHSLAGTVQADGSVVFTWENPSPATGDRYLWAVRTATGEPTHALVDAATVTVPAADAPGGAVCIEVSIVRADRSSSAEPAQGCVP